MQQLHYWKHCITIIQLDIEANGGAEVTRFARREERT